MKTLVSLSLTALAVLFLPQVALAVSVESGRLPGAQFVRESADQLTTVGCIQSSYQADVRFVDVPAGKPYRVVAADQAPATIFFCDPTIASQLTIQTPTVAGAQVAEAATLRGALSGFVDFIYGLGIRTLGGPSLGAANDVGFGVSRAAGGPGSPSELITNGALGTIGGIATVLAEVGRWLLTFAVRLFFFSLTASSFITNPLVRAGWPFIQGIANLGFMLALIFIALATTLQLEIGGGVRRLLPRLFIAALLLNFSLVIAGVLIDMTRVVMIILVNVLNPLGSSMDELPNTLLANTGILQSINNVNNLAPGKYNYPVTQIAKMILVWSLALSMLSLAIGFLVRYIMLTLLLILSPAAYLAFALPGAAQLGQRWWKEFFKYLLYGPVALFFVIIALHLNQLNVQSIAPGNTALQNVLNVVLMSALMIAAATASKSMGGAFSVAILNYAQGKATRAGKAIGKTGLAVGTAPARYVGKRAGDNVKDFGRDVTKNLRRSAFGQSLPGKLLLGPERDEKGKVKKGQKSLGTIAGGVVRGAVPSVLGNKTSLERVAAAKAVATRGLGAGANVTDPALASIKLRDAAVLKALTPVNVNQIAQAGSQQQVNAIVSNKDYLRDLDDDAKINLEIAIRSNLSGLSDVAQKARVLDKLARTLDEIDEGK